MSEELKATIRKVIDEAWNKGNLDALNELYAANYVMHNTPFPDIQGLEGFRQFVTGTRAAYPDLHFTIDELFIERDNVTTQWHWQGTNKGQSALFPFPPTGKEITARGCTVSHRMSGKTVEEWTYVDYLGVLQQLGIVPPMQGSTS